MGNQERVARANVGAFYGGVVQISLPIAAVGVEPPPGDPRPEDDWKVPTGPLEIDDHVNLEQVHSDGTVILPLHPSDEG
jgi:hypothetical protein